MIADLLWITALLCWMIALITITRRRDIVWVSGILLAIGWVTWQFAVTLPALTAPPPEIEDHLIISGKAYPHGSRLAYLSLEHAGECVLVDSRPVGEGRYWIRLECNK